MLHKFFNAPWWQLTDFLSKGHPPIIVQLLAINTIFFILLIVRRARGVPGMRRDSVIQVQALVVVANVLLLFQQEIIGVLRTVI